MVRKIVGISLLFTILTSLFSLPYPATAEPFFEEIEVVSQSGEMSVVIDSSEGLSCKEISGGFHTCQINFAVTAYLLTASVTEESLAKEIGRVEVFIGEKQGENFVRAKHFTSGLVNLSDVVAPSMDIVSLRGDTTNPENLLIWIAPFSSSVEVTTLPTEIDSIVLSSKEIDESFEPTDLSNKKLFYSNLESEGAWRDSLNRLPSGECEFGFDGSFEGAYFCSQVSWLADEKNDGFTKRFEVSINPTHDEFSTSYESKLTVSCTDKILKLKMVLSNAAGVGSNGSGLYRIDGGLGQKFKYRIDKNLQGITIDNPKFFTSALLKAKTKISFKVSNPTPAVIVFPKSDLKLYLGRFKALGCPIS